MNASSPSSITSAVPDSFVTELAALIIDSLGLEMAVDTVTAATPLYGEGLGLDSIDILELSLTISKKFGIQLKSDDPNNKEIFSSVGSLAHHIAAHRA
jgi:acyl carrier protein